MIREHWLPDSPESSPDSLDAARDQLQSLDVPEISPLRVLLTQLEVRIQRLSQTPEERSADLKTFLRRKIGTSSLLDFVRSAQSFLGSQTKVLIICDQFEELFVHYSGTLKLETFVSQIGEICKSDVNVQFLFSMREDWVGSMIEFRPAIPDIFSSYYKLPPMRPARALPALQLPLRALGYTMEDAVARRILLDLADCYPYPEDRHFEAARDGGDRQLAYFELPALQIVAEALWQSRGRAKPPFTLDHYNGLLKPTDDATVAQPGTASEER